MKNGAVLHYYFANADRNKSIGDALHHHQNVPWSYYSAVFANSGNDPRMSEESVLNTAFELQKAKVPFFWLSTYEGVGSIKAWPALRRRQFQQSGAKFVDISAMTLGLDPFTKGAIEHTLDPHFCLPGPPDEMGLLLLKMMWAVHEGHRE